VKRFRGLEGPARVFVVLACCGAGADLVSLVIDLRRHVHGDVLPVTVGIAQVVLLASTAVAYLWWLHRAYTNLPRLGVPDRFVPARLHDDIWRASDPELPWPVARSRWAAEPVPARHLLWWPAALAGAVAGVVPGGVLGSAAGDLLRVLAAGLAVPIVLAVTARQRARAYRAPWSG